MAKASLEEQESCINAGRKNVKYDTKEYTGVFQVSMLARKRNELWM